MSNQVYAKMTRESYQLKEGTKNSWLLVDSEVSNITELHYKNITDNDTLKGFRRLGGSETKTECYTCKGYRVWRLVSKNPDRTIKIVRTFDFEV